MKILENDVPYWLPTGEYQKIISQTRLLIGEILYPLRMYGQDVFVDGALDEIIQVVERYGLRVRGVDKPMLLKSPVNPRVRG